MKEEVSKRVFNIKIKGYSKLVRYLKELPSGETPIVCDNAKLLKEKVFVIKTNAIYECDSGKVVCPVYAEFTNGQEIECQGLDYLSPTGHGIAVHGYCGVIKKDLFMKVRDIES